MEERLEKLLEDPSFQEAFSKTASAEEASALFAQHGIQITPEELTAALAQLDGELDEDALNEVAGGAPVLRAIFSKWLVIRIGPCGDWFRNWVRKRLHQ